MRGKETNTNNERDNMTNATHDALIQSMVRSYITLGNGREAWRMAASIKSAILKDAAFDSILEAGLTI